MAIYYLYPENKVGHFDRPYQSFWVNIECFEILFESGKSGFYYPPGTEYELRPRFFNVMKGQKSIAFQFGRCDLGLKDDLYQQPYLSFSSGRHRSRWLIDVCKLKYLPLAMSSSSIKLATKLKLIHRPLLEGETIDLPIDHDFILSELGHIE